MDNADLPPLPAKTWESVEDEATAIHATYRHKLQRLSIGHGSHIEFAARQSGVARDPLFLCRTLAGYACAIFDAEAAHYPKHTDLPQWLKALNKRTEDRVWEKVRGMNLEWTLMYHVDDPSEMLDAIRDALKNHLESFQNRTTTSSPPTTADPQKIDTRSDIEAFIGNVLRITNRAITRKSLWTVAGYSDPTEFERFQRDDPKTTKTAIANFRRVLSMTPADFIRDLDRRSKR